MTAAVHVLPTAAALRAVPAPLPAPANVFAELRGLLASARGALDDLAGEVDTFTSLVPEVRSGSSRELVQRTGEVVYACLLAAQHRALQETTVCVPATMSCETFEAQARLLKAFSREVMGELGRVERLVGVATARKFKPRARRLDACGTIVQLCSELRRIDRDLSAAGVRS